MIKRIGITVVAVVAAMALSMAAQAADSDVGTWELNKAKSKGLNPELVAATLVVKARPDGGTTANFIQHLKDGTTVTRDHTCTDDGKECPVKVSNGNYDTVSVKRVDAEITITVWTKKGGKHKVTDTATTSKDGKILSGTFEGTDANGKPVSGAFFFDRK